MQLNYTGSDGKGDQAILTHPALQRAFEKFEAMRKARDQAPRSYQIFGLPRTGQNRHHSPLRLAYVLENEVMPLYMLVRYCEACERGYPVEIVREVPDGTPSAGELGLKQTRPWRVECSA